MARRFIAFVLAALAVAAVQLSAGSPKIVERKFLVDGHERRYALYVPATSPAELPPLLLVLHGTGDNGRMMVEHWKPLAERKHVVVAGLDAWNREGWQLSVDGPDVLHQFVQQIRSTTNFDERRIYVFGHSGGATYSILLALLESRYFAAVAAHAGMATGPKVQPMMAGVERPIPVMLFAGTDDPYVPIDLVRATRTQLQHAGLPVTLLELSGQDHEYEPDADNINKQAWDFFSGVRLGDPPQFVSFK